MIKITAKHYDVIIVGAGPAGIAAAIKLAQNNIPVLVIERGRYPGAKNMFGGAIYRKPTAKVIPNFWENAPLERSIITEELWLMDTTSAVKLGFSGVNFSKPPHNKFSVIRSKFDNWFAQQAVTAGAELLTNTVVIDLVYQQQGLIKKKVSGVKLDSGTTISANIVLLAEGGQAKLTLQAGLRDKLKAEDFRLYIKEELALPQSEINSRFNLKDNQGAIIAMMGQAVSNIIGKVGLWTNRNSLSLTIGANLQKLNEHDLELQEMMAHFKSHPLIQNLIKDTELINYKSLTVPDGGYHKLPKLYDDGILVAGNAARLVAGRRGSDLAMLSGIYAAEVITQAHAAQDYSAKILKIYEQKIKNSFFMQDIKKETTINNYYRTNPQIECMLSKSLNNAAYKFFDTGFISTSDKIDQIKSETLEMQPLPQTISDLFYTIKRWSVY
ncbi:FAD-dependent oxidoreductase [Halanaerobacter jeridensis]|uniref:Electron transfer flavoprotein-quinone oxidoreductase n=1 Tax=Halanaerobacter jeridensis TaxID=706427 RepID=A0A938XV49_9FIRM|nr:electron transfer flavoprotein-quinone oxidoreductase [Halanaerobacter jeridensis]